MLSMLRANGKRITVLRIQRGWPQEQLARIAYVSPRTVQRVEAGGNASFETLKSLAAAFKIEINELMEAGGKTLSESTPPKVSPAGALSSLIARLLPYVPALKMTLGSAAVVLLMAFAIRLSPFLAGLEPAIEFAESAVASAQFCPAVPPAMKAEQPRDSGRIAHVQAPESRRAAGKTRSAKDYAAIVSAEISMSSMRLEEPIPAGNPIAVTATPAFEKTGTGLTAAGTNDIDWLAGLLDFEPPSTSRTSKPSSEAIAAPDVRFGKPAAGTGFSDLASSGSVGGRGPISRTFVRSGKTTAAFFSKVGSSIKRAF